MQDAKPFYLSKTIWAGVVMVLVSLAGFFGYAVDSQTQQTLTELVMQVVGALSGLVAIYGRIVANTAIE